MAEPRPCAKCDDVFLRRTRVPAAAPQPAVEVDLCGRCRGVWLDWGEVGDLKDLQQLIPSMTGNAAWRRDLEAGQCPSCDDRAPLLRIPVGAYGIDRCPECLGLWFDGGELGPMLTEQGFEALLRALRRHPV